VTRHAVILFLLLIVPAHAQPAANAGFDPGLVTNVYSVALAFMAPRILEPVPVPELTVWGLRGLTALDPNLLASESDGRLLLTAGQHVVAEQPVPSGTAPAAWAAAAVRLSEAAAAVSPAVRKVGSQGIWIRIRATSRRTRPPKTAPPATASPASASPWRSVAVTSW